jgi:MFS family permease
MLALLFVDFIDEFASGIPTVGIPGIQSDFELTYTTVAFLVFTGPIFVGWILEPPIFLLADRYPKKWFVCGGLFAMGAIDLIIGLSGTFAVVAGALLLLYTASGAGVALSQATLMDTYPDERERLMTRWVFMGATGDLAAPALFWLLAVFALGWREAFVIAGVLIVVYAFLLSRQRFEAPPPREEDGAELGTWAALVLAFRDRKLLMWLFGSWLCSLMDELLVAFGALHMRDNLGADAETRSVILMALMLGSMAGLVVLDRLLRRFEPLKLLIAACLGTAISYVAWLSAGSVIASGFWIFATGLFAGALYPLAKAQAYRALPGRSGMLNAMAHVFTPLDMVIPLALGLVADRFGLPAALAVLLLQPIGLFAIALTQVRRRSTPA